MRSFQDNKTLEVNLRSTNRRAKNDIEGVMDPDIPGGPSAEEIEEIREAEVFETSVGAQGGGCAFVVKDSGRRREFESGMVRDVEEGKTDFLLVFDGPMLERWAEHLTKGAKKYSPRNWMKAEGEEELRRFRSSAARHFFQWLRGDQDEDHAAAVFFNINGAAYVEGRMAFEEDLKRAIGRDADGLAGHPFQGS
ncbi:MAG: hypothetical protein JRN42_07160 [Nitrososphaerota archaeon]|nr:hypothetical protein [Nitrososphaerota archaeon]